jgi:hypothetical protein
MFSDYMLERERESMRMIASSTRQLRAGFARPSGKETMTHGIIYYTGKKRIGKLQITHLCFHRMNQYRITTDELEEVFRYGREIEEGKIILGQICLFYVLDETRLFRGNLTANKFIIITCWKEVKIHEYY